jgi:hypothetical protein
MTDALSGDKGLRLELWVLAVLVLTLEIVSVV